MKRLVQDTNKFLRESNLALDIDRDNITSEDAFSGKQLNMSPMRDTLYDIMFSRTAAIWRIELSVSGDLRLASETKMQD